MDRVAAWFGGADRMLFVHAHPDDETIATGGTLAALAAAGRDPALVTLTRGERGEVRSTELHHLKSSVELAVYRERELQQALVALGVTRHAFLGSLPARASEREPRCYRDSGMEWADDGLAAPAKDAGPGALTAAAATDLIADLLAAADAWDIEAIVSYDALGGYRHPDHVRGHRVARAVAIGLELPFWEIVTERPVDEVTVTDQADSVVASKGSVAAEAYDISPWFEKKRAALRAYATQLAVDGDDLVHVGGQRQPIARTERFRRLT